MHRLTSKSYSDATPNVTYTYYPAGSGFQAGRLRLVSTAQGSTEYSYDDLGRVTASTQAIAGIPPTYAFAYTWLLNNGLATMQYPSGRLITYTHDDAGRVTQAWHESKVYAQGIGYAAHGAMTQMQLGNGLYQQWSCNGRLQPVAVRLGETPGSASKFGSVLGYGATANNGNIASQQIVGSGLNVTQSYGYDGLNRLTSATESGGWSATYGYDRHGNGWVATWSGISPSSFTPVASSWFNGQNRLTGLSAAYDLAGNQVAIGAYGSSYDAENRLKTSTIDGATTEYFYDGDGRRIRKRLPGGAERLYVYDAMGQLAAEYSTAPEAVSGTHYLTADHLGSTRAVTMQNQQVVERRDYLPFGEEVPASIGGRTPLWAATPTQPHRFAGKERDAETGLDYFGARYFSGAQGRFTSPDPVYFQKEMLADPQRWNLYAYVRNNPLRFIDPKGEAIELLGDEEERKKALEALRQGVGQRAGSYLYENKVTTKGKNGNEVTKYYVGIYGNGPDANGPAFKKINLPAAMLAGVIQSQEVVTFGLVSGGTTLTNDYGQQITIGSIDDGRSPGVTSLFGGGRLGVFILDPSTEPGQLPARMMQPSNAPGSVDQGILALHELGHAGYYMGALIPGPSNKAAVNLENMVRKSRNPNAPIRREH